MFNLYAKKPTRPKIVHKFETRHGPFSDLLNGSLSKWGCSWTSSDTFVTNLEWFKIQYVSLYIGYLKSRKTFLYPSCMFFYFWRRNALITTYHIKPTLSAYFLCVKILVKLIIYTYLLAMRTIASLLSPDATTISRGEAVENNCCQGGPISMLSSNS